MCLPCVFAVCVALLCVCCVCCRACLPCVFAVCLLCLHVFCSLSMNDVLIARIKCRGVELSGFILRGIGFVITLIFLCGYGPGEW
jgi:hypothetical protein